jgi:DNA-binding response OmpR family regulator
MPTLNRSRVLCVDDDEDACEIFRLLMSTYGFDATCVQSAAAAWPLIKQHPFDLYILDGWLPRTDGFEFCRQLREFDAETPILFYSGAGFETDKRNAMAAGANAYVTKPDFESLIEAIASLTGEARGRDGESRWVGGQQREPATNSISAQFFSVASAGD